MNQNNNYLKKLPRSSKKIISILSDEGTLTQKELIIISQMPAKTARYALKRLQDENLIVATPNLADMRSSNYALNPEINLNLMHAYINNAKSLA